MITYDVKCEELALHFLGDAAPALAVKDLASDIQQAIEDWFFMYEREKEQEREDNGQFGVGA
jgi:hypothetical protein